MKAHIQTQFPPKILFYAIKPGSEKERALAGLCREEGILWEEVPAGRLGDPLGCWPDWQAFPLLWRRGKKNCPLGKPWCFVGWKKKRFGSYWGKWARRSCR